MAKVRHGLVVETILATLEREGPQVYAAIARGNGLPMESTRKACARLASEPRKTRRIFVKDWTTEAVAERAYLRPVYALGNQPNKRRPPPMARKDIVSRYYKKAQAELGCNAFGPLYGVREARARIAEHRRGKNG